MDVSENYYVDEKGTLRYDDGFYTSCQQPEWQEQNKHKEVTGVWASIELDTNEGFDEFMYNHELDLEYVLFLKTK